MCLPALPLVIGGAALLGAGTSYLKGKAQAKSQAAALAQSESQARAQSQMAEQQYNRANQKQPSIAALFNSNRRGSSSGSGRGIGSTFLTGTSGIKSMPLGGGPSLLGG